MDVNVNEQSQGRHDRHFQAKHGQWDFMKLYPYDHMSFFFSFILMLLHPLTSLTLRAILKRAWSKVHSGRVQLYFCQLNGA